MIIFFLFSFFAVALSLPLSRQQYHIVSSNQLLQEQKNVKRLLLSISDCPGHRGWGALRDWLDSVDDLEHRRRMIKCCECQQHLSMKWREKIQRKTSQEESERGDEYRLLMIGRRERVVAEEDGERDGQTAEIPIYHGRIHADRLRWTMI